MFFLLQLLVKRERDFFLEHSTFRFDVELRSPVTKAMLGALAKNADMVTASLLRKTVFENTYSKVSDNFKTL